MTEASPQVGTIPQSSALSEATAEDSLSVLLSRDPEGYQEQDLVKIIEALREMRARLATAELAGGGKPERGEGTKRVSKRAQSLVATKNASEMDI